MSLRSKVVIESNLKPSKFGKPAIINSGRGSAGSGSDNRRNNSESAGIMNNNNNEDDFEEIYENPLEKLKPLPPRIEELPRNDPETMEFSNASIKNNYNNNNNSMLINDLKHLSINDAKQSSSSTNNDHAASNYSSNRNSNNNNNNNNNNYDNDNGNGNRESASRIRDNDYHNNSQVFNDNNTRTVIVNEKLISVENADQSQNGSNNNNNNNDNKNGAVEDKPDISFRDVAANIMKSLDVNRYATKKTIAQGMLDIALLTANASQLKYILQIGQQHEFYILMLSLICVSIGLQILSGLLSLSLNLMRDCKMEDNTYARSVEWVGKARLIHGIVCVLLGSTCNLNKQRDHNKANIWNNIGLILMILTVAVNAVISAFDMRDTTALTKANLTRGNSAAANIRTASGGR